MATTATKERLRELEAERQALLEKENQDRAAYKLLVAERVPGVVQELIDLEEQLIKKKAEVFNAFRDIIELKQEVYGVKGQQQSHTFSSGDYSIELGYRVNSGWDDTVKVGVAKVHEFIESQASDEKSKRLVSAILKLLKPDKQGNLNPSRVLDLKQLSDEWGATELMDAVDIIVKAHQPQKSNWFVVAKQPDEVFGTRPVGLSMSSVDFPEGFSFNFVNEIPSENA